MPDYKEQSISGTSWQRCNRIVIENQYGELPFIAFEEQNIVNIDGSLIKNGVGNITIQFDPNAEFDIYDPVTLQPTGQRASHTQMYGLLFSAYMTAAKARDVAKQNATPGA